MSFERTTPCGVISGTACQWPGIAAYKGIRYATAGRWEFPVPVTHWDGVYDATQYGACCYQPRAFFLMLIQVGGLGLVTLTSFFALAARRRLFPYRKLLTLANSDFR